VKVKFDTTLKTLDGDPIKQDDKDFTLRQVAVNALMSFGEKEAKIGGKEKFDRYKLANKIHNGADGVKPEEIAKIKELIGELYGPLVVGQAWMVLDGDEEPEPEK
jgi:hypothetical protein